MPKYNVRYYRTCNGIDILAHAIEVSTNADKTSDHDALNDVLAQMLQNTTYATEANGVSIRIEKLPELVDCPCCLGEKRVTAKRIKDFKNQVIVGFTSNA